ncbi:MAG: arylsulfotransferase family protein [Planctomycetota bacterium]
MRRPLGTGTMPRMAFAKLALAALVVGGAFAAGAVLGRRAAPDSENAESENPDSKHAATDPVAPQEATPAPPGDPNGAPPPSGSVDQQHPDGPARRDRLGLNDPRWHRPMPGTLKAPTAPQGDPSVVPYLQGVEEAPSQLGVRTFDPDRAHVGLNLVISGHAPAAYLVDMKGEVLHEWSRSFDSVWPGPVGEKDAPKLYWRRAHLYPNGDLLAIFEGLGMIKIDAASELLWEYPGHCHHAIDIGPDGTIYTLSRRRVQKSFGPWVDDEIVDDFVTLLTPEGTLIREISVFDAIARSPYAPVLARNRRRVRDILHTNSIELLDGTHAATRPMLAADRVLISIRHLDMVAVLDLAAAEITWAMTELWHLQHEPTVVADGNLLVFDNRGRMGKTRILELDPVAQRIVWQYAGTPSRPLDSLALGSCQRLANGNTLITESHQGRALEVTPGGAVVWEFVSPHRAGANDQLIACLFEVIRIDWSYPQFEPIASLRDGGSGIDLRAVEALRGGQPK